MAPESGRRAFLRVLAEFPVTWSRLHADGSLGPRYSTTTINASAGGVGIVTSEPVWQGERMRLEVQFGQPVIPVQADATVVRAEHTQSDRWSCGLEFDNLDWHTEQRLVQWVFAEERRVADRRASVRIPLQVIVTCRAVDGRGAAFGPPFKAATVDVAGDGLRVQTERALDADQLLHLEFSLGNPPQPLAVLGRIVWSKPTQAGWRAYGIHFEGLDEHTSRTISERAYAHELGQRGPVEPRNP